MTPYQINVLLHYYCRAVDHPDVERNPPIWRETVDGFIEAGLLCYLPPPDRDVTYPTTYAMTERGDVYCEALQLVPLPVWAMSLPELNPAPAAVARGPRSRQIRPRASTSSPTGAGAS